MVSINYFSCKQCDTEFILDDKPYCPKCSSFNIKPLENRPKIPGNDSVPIIEEVSDTKAIKKRDIPIKTIEFGTGIIPRIFFVIYLTAWFFGMKMLLSIFEKDIELLFIAPLLIIIALPLLIITFFVPIVLYQSYVK